MVIVVNVCSIHLAFAANIDNLRFSSAEDKVRIVLDSKDAIKYVINKKERELLVLLPKSTSNFKKPIIKDSFIKSVILAPNAANGSKLTVKLNGNFKIKAFPLSNPNRLVIDILKVEKKIEKIDKVQNLYDGVNYRFIQDELTKKQYQAYIVSIEKNADFELRPFSVAGDYNGRGSLLKQATKLGLLAAVNASYFDSDGWVIGVTKDKGRIISMDDTPHSALIVNKGVPNIVKDVAYSGYVEMNKGKRLQIKGLNRARIAEDCVLYNNAYAPTTKTNQWGCEVKLNNGRVTTVSRKGNMPIEKKDIIISGHGANAMTIATMRPGMRVNLVQSLGNPTADAAETVLSAGPLLAENGLVNVRTREENIAGDIAYGRSPRTAIGITQNNKVLLVVVDGRSDDSCGMTLNELAAFMIKLGAKEALNLDGGGSSELVVKGRIMNKPSDGQERQISMGLGLFRK